jgi:hypothetical protein
VRLTDIEADLYRRLGYASSPATDVTTRIRAFINQVHRQLLTLPGLEYLRDDTITFASVNAQARYGLPPSVARIKAITDRTNDRRITLATLDQLRNADPGLDANGTPASYVPIGWQAVSVQPSDASELFVDSTSASDTNTAYLEGIRTGGYPRVLSVTMTGTTAVTFSAAITDFIEVTKFYLSAAAVGTVTLHEDASGGTELARIPIGQTYARYVAIQLYPTPSAAVTYYVDYQRHIEDMSNANDEPLVPEDFHDLLVTGAERLEWRKKDDSREANADAEFSYRMKQLKYWIHTNQDHLPVAGKPALSRTSRLGSQYSVDAGWV